MDARRHVLLVGGSGMLRGVALEHARRGWSVSVVARRERPLRRLADEAASVVPLAVDYTDTSRFLEEVRKRCGELGPPAAAVVWIHRTAPDAPLLLARELAAAAGEDGFVDYLHVVSRSRTPAPRDPTVPSPVRNAGELQEVPRLRYRQAVLGWVVEERGSRWLTHDEIARGVIDAFDSGAAVTAIGTIDPLRTAP